MPANLCSSCGRVGAGLLDVRRRLLNVGGPRGTRAQLVGRPPARLLSTAVLIGPHPRPQLPSLRSFSEGGSERGPREHQERKETFMRIWLAVLLAASSVVVSANLNRSSAGASASVQPAAPSIDPKLFAGLRWRSIGPARGGRSIAVAGSAARRDEYYFGATGGGLWKTTDGGVTWRPVSDRLLQDVLGRRRSRGRIATRTSSTPGWGKCSFAATSFRATASTSTADGGRTWTHAALKQTMVDRPHPGAPHQS